MVLDAGFFYAATSFITVARRTPLWEFCRGFLGQLDVEKRERCRRLVLELLPDAGFPHPTWSLAEYEPRRKPTAARHAAYSANLTCLAVLLSDGPVDTMELVGEPVVTRWRAQAQLWQSQLDPEDRQRLWQTLRVAWDLNAEPAVLSVRVEDGTPVSVYESLPWPPDEQPTRTLAIPQDIAMPSESSVGRALRRSAFVQTAYEVREHLYALMPYWTTYGDTTINIDNENFIANGAALMELLLQPADPTDEYGRRIWLYLSVLQHVGPVLRGPVLRQFLRDAIHLHESQIRDIVGTSASLNGGELDSSIVRLVLKLSGITQGWSTPEELAEAVRTLNHRDLAAIVMTMLNP